MTVPTPQLTGDPFNVPLPHQWEENPPMAPGMDDADLLALLKREETGAHSFRSSILADEQANALEFYDAKPFGDEVDGQSQVVTPDVAEVVDYMTIAIMEACTAGEIVKFKPKVTDPQLVKQATDSADEATEAVKNAFFDDQDGYTMLVGWAQSGLIEKFGVAKATCVTERRNKRSSVMVDQDQLAMLDTQGLLLDYSDAGEGTFQARVQHKVEHKRYLDVTVPSEEFIFAARTRDIDATGYVAQRSRVTRSSLVEMGFHRDLVDSLAVDTSTAWENELDYVRWGSGAPDSERDGAMSEVLLLEEYVRADKDGDGVVELLQVFRVGDVILEANEVDEQPFVVFCPLIRAHRLVGDSVAEKVMDLQRIRSVVTRQTIDGVILTNRPRAQIDENSIGDTTIDDYLTPGPGVLIRTRAGGEIKPFGEMFDISQGLGLLQFLVGERESRTGMTRLNQGMKADDLRVETATAFDGLQKQGQRFERFICRAFGNAVAKLFRKKLRLMIAEGDTLLVQVDGEYRQANPSAWDGDMPLQVKIGVGAEDSASRLANWQLMIQDQNNLVLAGSPLVTPENMYRARDGAIRDMGLGNPNEFYTDPSTPEAQQAQASQPPKQDPKVVEAQVAQQQAQSNHEQAMAKLQLQQQAQEAAQQLSAQQAEQQAQLSVDAQAHAQALKEAEQQHKALIAEQQQQAQAALAVRQQDFNEALAQRELDAKMALAREQHEHGLSLAAEAHSAKVAALRPGGDLDK